MGWFQSCWMKCLLVMLLMQHYNSQTSEISKKFAIKIRVKELTANSTEAGANCDQDSDKYSAEYCQWRVQLKINCDDCEEKTATYPGEDTCWVKVERTSGHNLAFLEPIVFLSNSDKAKLQVNILAMDSFCRDIRKTNYQINYLDYYESALKNKTLSKIVHDYGTLVIEIETKCLSDLWCGGKCVAPESNLRCYDDKIVCVNGHHNPECVVFLFGGKFVWNLNLLHFQTNYQAQNLTSSCYEVVSACILHNGKCIRQIIGWNYFAKPVNSLIQENDLTHLSSTFTLEEEISSFLSLSFKFNVTTYCNGHRVVNVSTFEETAFIEGRRIFKFRSSDKLLFGVITSCNSKTDRKSRQCEHATNHRKTNEPKVCYDFDHSSACAFDSLCVNYTCQNGGTCMLRRSDVNVDAYDDGQLLNKDEELEKYSAECECPDEYHGSRCELETVEQVATANSNDHEEEVAPASNNDLAEEVGTANSEVSEEEAYDN